MSISEKFMDNTIRAIGYIIKSNYKSCISVKKLRQIYKIESVDNSKINFYWRCLQILEKNRVIERYGTKSPKKYRVLNFFKFFNLLYDAYTNQVRIGKNNSYD